MKISIIHTSKNPDKAVSIYQKLLNYCDDDFDNYEYILSAGVPTMVLNRGYARFFAPTKAIITLNMGDLEINEEIRWAKEMAIGDTFLIINDNSKIEKHWDTHLKHK